LDRQPDLPEHQRIEEARTMSDTVKHLLGIGVATTQGALVPLSVRIRASIAALPFEHPKLQVTANINAQNFADEIEAAMIRSGKPLTIGGTCPKLPARR
jgi:hypothetical protein